MFTLAYDIAHDPRPYWVGFVVLPLATIGALAGLVLSDKETRIVRWSGVALFVGAWLFWTYG